MVSIVIPLYNKESSIVNTINSVLNQSYSDFELLIIDNNSTDNSIKNVLSINDKRVRILFQPQKGVCAARNLGIKEAKSDYVALLDADDLWDKDCLIELVNLTIDFPDAGLLGVNYADIIEESIIPYKQGLPDGFRGYVDDYFRTKHGDLYCSSSVILRKDFATKVGLFDERISYAEDLDFWYRLILNSRVVFYNKVLSYYNKNADNRVELNINAHFDIQRRMEFYIEKYVPYFKERQDFSKFICLRIAWNILNGGYYFGGKYDRLATDKIVKYLDYKNMPIKYTFIFKTPRFIGKFIYKLIGRIKKNNYDFTKNKVHKRI